ncbi:MAG TPA: ABC transporter permease [Actinocrinis sp.]|nr:ABC transporter permease [Actinocrinis sp.]
MSAAAGTRQLARLAARRDRIVLPVWLYALVGLAGSSAYSIRGLYPDQASRAGLVDAVGAAPTAAALYGGILNGSLGAITGWRVGVLGSVLAAVMSILLVTRHTRAEEQNGRQELVSAGMVGRYAFLAAALQLVLTANLLAGLGIAGVCALFGLPAAGSFALGLGIAGCGVVFAGLAAVTAQPTGSSRSASGLAFTLLGVAYLVRAAGDMSTNSWLLWCSPIGWFEQVRAFGGDRWWTLALPLAGAALLVLLAGWLLGRRDYGSGLLPARLGPDRAGPGTRGVTGLAWRLHRAQLAGWAAGLFAMGAVFGSFAKDVSAFSDSARVQKVMAELGGTQNLADAYLVTINGLVGLLAGGYAVSVVCRARAEESGGRAEAVLAGAVTRTRWLLSHLLIAAAGSAALLVAAGVGAGLGDGLRVHDVPGTLRTLIGAALAQWPAVLVVAGLAVLLFGLRPTLTNAAWGPLGLFVFLGLIGPELGLSQAVLDLSPFVQVPRLPGGHLAAAPLCWLAALALCLLTAGMAGFRRRDLG